MRRTLLRIENLLDTIGRALGAVAGGGESRR